jgi:hypothetical protein
VISDACSCCKPHVDTSSSGARPASNAS